MNHTGEIAALTVAGLWTVTALLFEVATKRIGVLAVNIIRLFFGFILLSIICKILRGTFFPFDASVFQWTMLSLSGLVGFVLGDWCLLKSFEKSGGRISMLMLASNPAIAAILGYFVLSETLTSKTALAMLITFAGIGMAVYARNHKSEHPITFKGLMYGLGSAVGQAGGLILSKKGMGHYDAFAATQIRIIAGFFGFLIIMIVSQKTQYVIAQRNDSKTMLILLIGALLGPCLGVGLSLYAVQYANAGIASSIMSIIPILIIIPSVFIFKQKITRLEVIGAFLSTGGVILFFL